MQPVVDEDFIPDLPLRMRERGQYNRATLMSGITAEDGSLYAPFGQI
jgi:carboxylesterase type B